MIVNKKKKFKIKKKKIIQIKAPINKLITNFSIRNLVYRKNQIYKIKFWLKGLNDKKILNYYANLICHLINFYRITHNFNKIKKFIKRLKWNCYYILSEKYKKPKVWIYSVYKKNIELGIINKQILSLPSLEYVQSLKGKQRNLNYFTKK